MHLICIMSSDPDQLVRSISVVCRLLPVLPLFIIGTPARAHEGIARAGLREPPETEIESEFYAGRGGYWHSGLGMVTPLGERLRLGIAGHAVREETGAAIFPSLG